MIITTFLNVFNNDQNWRRSVCSLIIPVTNQHLQRWTVRETICTNVLKFKIIDVLGQISIF